MTPNWLDIQSVPGDLLDGDDDTLSGISLSGTLSSTVSASVPAMNLKFVDRIIATKD